MSTVKNPLTVIQVIDASYTKLLDKPVLDTNNTSSLSFSSNEEINGTIKLHKVSKTGVSTDLVDSSDLVRQTAFSALNTRVGTAETKITTIEGKIPTAASAQNQLADKQYVIDTFQNSMGTFKGSWNTWSAVPSSGSDYPPNFDETSTPHTNDYMVVLDTSGYNSANKGTWRFKYSGVWSTNGKNGWSPEYQINEEPMTQAQLDAINSGITSELVTQIGTNRTNIADLMPRMTAAEADISTLNTNLTTVSNKVDANSAAIISINTNISGLTTRMGTAETNISTLNTNLEAVDDKVDINITNISALDTRMTTAEGAISTNASNISVLSTRMTTVETTLGSLDNNYVKFSAVQTLTNEQKSQARANIGAGTSSFNGSYSNLTNKPILDTTNIAALSPSNVETIDGTINLHKISKTGTSTDLIDSADLIRTSQFNTLALRVTTTETNITSIASKIPSQASSTNQLADKDFVNSSINAFVAYYITKNAAGDPFATKAELTSATVFYSGGVVRVPTTNDYCIVLADESKQSATGADPTTRYSYQNNQWQFQWIINDTPLTAAQLAAINSGITNTLVGKITTNESNISDLNTRFSSLGTAATRNTGTSSGNVPLIGSNGKLDSSIIPIVQIVVDDALSTSSTNPVQNKVITNALDNKQDELSQTQLAAVNSGITSTLVGKITTNESNITSLQTGKQDKLTAGTNINIDANNVISASGLTKITDTTVYIRNLDPGTYLWEITSSGIFNYGGGSVNINGPAEIILLVSEGITGKEFVKIDGSTISCGTTTYSSGTLSSYKPNGFIQNYFDTPTLWDNTPTENSTKPVTSRGIFTALASKANSTDIPTAVSQLTNDSGFITNFVNNLTNYYLKTETYSSTEIDSMISSVYKPAGSVTFANLPTLSSSVLGNVYNVTDAFITTNDFVEGAGKSYSAGTNVVVIDAGSGTYKFDVLAGFVDLSGYVPTSRTINGHALTGNVTILASDIGAVRYDTASQGLTSTQQSNARTNIGLGTVATKNTGTSSGNIPLIGSNGKLDSSIIPVVQIVVDDTLSTTSTNPVQNKVITNAINTVGATKANTTLSNVTYPAITLGGTTTGSGDRVIEQYISSDGNTWYRKWASGWKECGLQNINSGAYAFNAYTLPIAFSSISSYQIVGCLNTEGNLQFAARKESATSIGVANYGNHSVVCTVYCCGY